MSRTVTLYAYDAELRPGTIGADFDEDLDPNRAYTLRYEPEEGEKLMRDVATFLKGSTHVA